MATASASSTDSTLVAYFPFTGNACDSSNRFYTGPAGIEGVVLTTDRFGISNRAYYFNGRSKIYATVHFTMSLARFTLAAWIKSDAVSQTLPRIVSVNKPGMCTAYYGLLYDNGSWGGRVDTSKRFIFLHGNPADPLNYTLQYSHAKTDSTQWHHGAVSWDNGRLRFYVDGVLDKDTVFPSTDLITQFPDTAVLQIGFCDGGGFFIGKLDDIRIYNRALSDAEITAIFNKPE
jgi:hypothetical protein